MFLRGELPNDHLRHQSAELVEAFEKITVGTTLIDCIAVAGHLFECVWLAYIQEMVATKAIKTRDLIGLFHQTLEGLSKQLVQFTRQKARENGTDVSNIIQLPNG